MQTLTSSATWPATVLTVIGMRSAPPPSATAPAQPAVAGGSAKFTSGFDVDTVARRRAPTSRAAGRDQCGQRGGHPVQRPRPRFTARRTVAMHQAHPEDDGGQGQCGPPPPRGGPHGEAQRRAVVGHHHLVGVARRAHSLDVGHAGRPGEADAPPGLMGPPAQVHVLGVHEVRLVEASEFLEGVAPGQEAGSGDPSRLDDVRRPRGRRGCSAW